jgi:hypothetical protein
MLAGPLPAGAVLSGPPSPLVVDEHAATSSPAATAAAQAR